MINKKLKLLEDDHARCLSMHMAHIEPNMHPSNHGMFSGCKSMYADPPFESLLNFIKPKVEEVYGKPLVPTYSFWRTYYKQQDCPPHKDRPSCEISVTLCIDASDKTDMWAINVEDQVFKLNVGEGVIYKGCDQEHWRPGVYKGEGMAQVFLHYVNQDGIYKNHAYDQIEKEIKQKI